MQKLRNDQDREYLNKEFTIILDQNAIHHELSTIYTLQQNDFLEHDNWNIIEYARNMLHAFYLPIHLWAEVDNCTIYLLNMTMNKQLGSIVPYEKWFAHKPSVSQHRVFSSTLKIHGGVTIGILETT